MGFHRTWTIEVQLSMYLGRLLVLLMRALTNLDLPLVIILPYPWQIVKPEVAHVHSVAACRMVSCCLSIKSCVRASHHVFSS